MYVVVVHVQSLFSTIWLIILVIAQQMKFELSEVFIMLILLTNMFDDSAHLEEGKKLHTIFVFPPPPSTINFSRPPMTGLLWNFIAF